MIQVRRTPSPDAVRSGAKHRLFVEGGGDEAIDPRVLKGLLRGTPVRVDPLGPSHHVRSAAHALLRSHPNYFFLVERDHHSADDVESSWRAFPDPGQQNLLIWRRRELENYFIIPEYLARSRFLNCSEDELLARIIAEANRRLYLDAANRTITSVRERMKATWIEAFTRVEEMRTRREAIAQLLQRPEFARKKSSVGQLLRKDRIESTFERYVDEMTGGREPLEFGQGNWLEMVRGKAVLPPVINHCFRVVEGAGAVRQGPSRQDLVVRDLVAMDIKEQPEDFQQLRELILAVVKRDQNP